jgi:hypothetical protein
VVAAVAALFAALLAWVAWRWGAPRGTETGGAARPDSASTGYKAARLFFAAPSGDSLVTESRDMAETTSLHDRVAALVSELERGPREGGVAVLPPGTAVLAVYLDDRGTLTLDLSPAFQQRFQGGSSAEYLAIASLSHTLADGLPEAKRVIFTCAGSPLASLGGHLPLDRPIEVADLP